MWQLWLIIAGFFLILEIFTVGFLVFWFGIGALITMVASFFISNEIVLGTIFLISSALLLFLTKKFFNKVVETDVKTNAFSIQGKTGKVIIDIDPSEGTGQIKVNGEIWSAKSFDNRPISKDTEVTVEKIDGVKAIVIPLNK